MAAPVYYNSASIYIKSATDLNAKIIAVQAVIDALYAQILVLAEQDSPIQEYMLNDGQTVIKGVYSSPSSITKTIDILEKQKNQFINQLNGRHVRMIDSKNFTGNGFC